MPANLGKNGELEESNFGGSVTCVIKQKRKRRKSYVEQTPEDFRKMDEEQRLSQKLFKEQILLDRKIGHKQILKSYYKNKEQLKQQSLLKKYKEMASEFI